MAARLAGLMAAMAVAVTTMAVGAAPAGAQAAATFTFAPTTFEAPTGQVVVTWSGADPSLYAGQCAATVLDGPDLDPATYCTAFDQLRAESGSATWTVRATFTTVRGDAVVCQDVPGGCIVAVGSGVLSGETAAWAPLAFPELAGVTLAPAGALPVGQEVTVALDGLQPGAPYRLATCLAGELSPSSCAADALVPALTAGPDGTATATVTPRLWFDDTTTCVPRGCAVAVLPEDGSAVVGVQPYTFADGVLTLSPNRAVPGPPAGTMRADLEGLASGRTYELRHCHRNAVAVDGDADLCAPDALAAVIAGPDGTATATLPTAWTIDSPATEPFTCQGGGDCAVGAVLADAERGPRAVAMADFVLADATVTLPGGELLPGEAVPVGLSGLRPGGNYHLAPCHAYVELGRTADACDLTVAGPSFVAGPDGTATATVPIVAEVDLLGLGRVRCQQLACAVGVLDEDFHVVPGFAPYDAAMPELAATPSTGLSDGQVVHVTGTNVSPGFDGPLWWIFPTGTWGIGQCTASMPLSPLAIDTVFRSCVPAPGTGPIDVPGTSFAVDVAVQAQIDPVLGDPVDCTASPGCVIALTRIERDGSVTAHTTPIEFTSP